MYCRKEGSVSNAPILRPASLADIIHAHKVARSGHNEQQMKRIEDTLTNINYHIIRDLMHDGEYV